MMTIQKCVLAIFAVMRRYRRSSGEMAPVLQELAHAPANLIWCRRVDQAKRAHLCFVGAPDHAPGSAQSARLPARRIAASRNIEVIGPFCLRQMTSQNRGRQK